MWTGNDEILSRYGRKRNVCVLRIFTYLLLPLLIYEWILVCMGTYQDHRKRSLVYGIDVLLTVSVITNYISAVWLKDEPYSCSQLLKELGGIINLFIFALSCAFVYVNPLIHSCFFAMVGITQMCMMGVEVLRIESRKYKKMKAKRRDLMNEDGVGMVEMVGETQGTSTDISETDIEISTDVSTSRTSIAIQS